MLLGFGLMLASGGLIFTGGAEAYFAGLLVPAQDDAAAGGGDVSGDCLPDRRARRTEPVPANRQSPHRCRDAAVVVQRRLCGARDCVLLRS